MQGGEVDITNLDTQHGVLNKTEHYKEVVRISTENLLKVAEMAAGKVDTVIILDRIPRSDLEDVDPHKIKPELSVLGNKMFDELVTKGETLEEDAKSKFKSTTNDVENRVADVRKKLGLDSEPADQRIEELSAKIDALTEAVAKLAASK